MKIISLGEGTPVVLVPGIQGRWEYMRRAVHALAACGRVITFSLCDEPAAEYPCDPLKGFDAFADQIERALDTLQLDRAVICGVSFGGLAALHFAAHRPARALALVLASTPGPRWHLKRSHELYAAWPRLFAPLFFAGMPLRLRPEVAAALPTRRERWRLTREQIGTLKQAPVSASRMAARARLMGTIDWAAEGRTISTPTLVVTGDPDLDHVVPATGTSEYVGLIGGARYARLAHTGHLGCITRPQEFAAIVCAFARTAQRSRGANPHAA